MRNWDARVSSRASLLLCFSPARLRYTLAGCMYYPLDFCRGLLKSASIVKLVARRKRDAVADARSLSLQPHSTCCSLCHRLPIVVLYKIIHF